MYLLIILHQTATISRIIIIEISCIFLSSYIKPQRYFALVLSLSCCIFLSSYIKPQLHWQLRPCDDVVSSYHPTSNRNVIALLEGLVGLYLLIILHQTATTVRTNHYILCCIFLSSYIKPQRVGQQAGRQQVVSSYHPTSNRNSRLRTEEDDKLYLLIILHQTATTEYNV